MGRQLPFFNNMAKITTYLSVFEQRLKKLKDNIEDEIKKPKKERRKSTLKEWLREARDLRHTLKEVMPEEDSAKRCPHCGEKL